MDVKDLGCIDHAKPPVRTICHHEIAPAQAHAPVLERPIQEAAGDQRPAGVLAEEMTLVA
jgi:hypothetical protein